MAWSGPASATATTAPMYCPVGLRTGSANTHTRRPSVPYCRPERMWPDCAASCARPPSIALSIGTHVREEK